MEESQYLDFLNPVHIIWRKGTVSDPYIDRTEISKVVNQRIQLLEVPDKVYRVRISGLTEVNYENFLQRKLNENEYYVDYSNGMVFFHTSKEADTLTMIYRGRGFILYPSTRIYHNDGKSDVIITLNDIINNISSKLDELEIENSDLADLKQRLEEALHNNNVSADELRVLIEKSQEVIDLTNDAYNTTKIIYQPYVETYDDINPTYPFPKVGWAVQARDTGIRYRWNGDDWIPIDILGGNVPLANEHIDGLMSKEDYVKLNNYTENIETRVIVFIIPQELLTGVQDPHIMFPFDGTIVDIKASVSNNGSADTEIFVEKSTDYENWTNIMYSPLRIKANNYFDDREYELNNNAVSSGDIFRLRVPLSSDVTNLTLNIKIEL